MRYFKNHKTFLNILLIYFLMIKGYPLMDHTDVFTELYHINFKVS